MLKLLYTMKGRANCPRPWTALTAESNIFQQETLRTAHLLDLFPFKFTQLPCSPRPRGRFAFLEDPPSCECDLKHSAVTLCVKNTRLQSSWNSVSVHCLTTQGAYQRSEGYALPGLSYFTGSILKNACTAGFTILCLGHSPLPTLRLRTHHGSVGSAAEAGGSHVLVSVSRTLEEFYLKVAQGNNFSLASVGLAELQF